MAQPTVEQSQNNWIGGISDYQKQYIYQDKFPGFVFAKAVNFRDDPNSLTLLPGAVKESGSVVTDLLKWGDTVPTLTKYFFYGSTGWLYQRTSTGVWSALHQAVSSHGNGLQYFTGDDYLYYTTDSTVGRYGPVSGSSPQFSDDFLKAAGGVPTNTNSLSLVAASSQYATAADSTSLSQTGDITLEAYFKLNSLPTVGNSMTLIGKWDESGATRSYKMDINAISGYFGNGSDGSLTISSNTTEAPIDSACTGTVGSSTLTATNASFAQGQVILIHQSQGTNAGQWERNTINGYTAGTITLGTPLLGSYTTGAQVRVLKQYSSVTINSGQTWTVKAWNGTTGGILAYLCSGTTTGTGIISGAGADGLLSTTGGAVEPGNGGGFRGGITAENTGVPAGQGEGTAGSRDTTSANANGNGGGAGWAPGSGNTSNGGGGGGNSQAGASGTGNQPGSGGNMSGSSDLTSMTFGGGGGGGGGAGGTSQSSGANGGAIIFIVSVGLVITGGITVNGGNAQSDSTDSGAGGGGGAGGSILLKAQTASLGSNLITATGGSGGTFPGATGNGNGGNGADGRIVLDYLTSYTGTTSPTINSIQDNTLVTTATYQARLGISNDGTAAEYSTYNLTSLMINTWNRLSISWAHSTSVSTFYLNGNKLETFTGSKTAISDNSSLLYVGANKGSSTVGNFLDGLIDDVRIWGNLQSDSQILANNQLELTGSEGGLQAYYKLDNAATDATGNANNLTLVNSPVYSTDVPFPGATTRLDIDSSATGGTNTYTLPTSISEASSDTLAIPWVNDPQKSIAFEVNAAGTGNWTVTVHDKFNNIMAQQTITNANIPSSGFVEFIFPTPWRPLTGKTYHAHLTVSSGTSSVKVTTASNFSSVNYYDYFGFLVTDTAYHPVLLYQNFLVIGNERYVAKWDGAFYFPNQIELPPGWRVRCFAFWREYLAIGVWKGTNIYDYPKGRIYFWDGASPTFNFFIDIGDGQVNAMYGIDSDLYIMAGWRGFLHNYQGGFFYNTGNTRSNKLKRLPNNRDFGASDYQEIYPGAMNMWRSLLYVGLAGASNSSTIQKGVYSWGTFNANYPDVSSYDFPISTGNTGSTVSIGCVYPCGKQLIIGWQDGIAYGADVIDFANDPAPSGYVELLLQDQGAIWHNKNQLAVRADHLGLNSGEGVDVKWKINRSSNWTVGTKNTVADSTFTKTYIDGSAGRGVEYQIAADLSAAGSTSPTLTGLSIQGDPLTEEKIF